MSKPKAILSDMGDVLFSTEAQAARRMDAFGEIFLASGVRLSPEEIMERYKPFKGLGQTVMPEEEGVNLFFKKMGIKATYDDFKRLASSAGQSGPVLFPGVTECLEYLHKASIPFGVVSDTSMREPEMWASLEGMVASQLRQRGVYDSSGFRIRDYVSGVTSSRDVGVKKPEERIFRYALERLGEGLGFGDAMFIAHESGEIFGAADLGLGVIVFNHRIERDAGEIEEEVAERNKRFKSGKAPKYQKHIYMIDSFSDISALVEGMR